MLRHMLAFWMALCYAFCGSTPLPAGRGVPVLYLRVVARDDTAAGQAEKLRIRDAVLAACDGASPPRLLPLAASAAGQEAPDCHVSLRLWTPDAQTPPAPTVYITVGAGGGHNWWGVLYEDAARLAAIQEAPESDNAGNVNVMEESAFILRWPLLEWLLRCLGWTRP